MAAITVGLHHMERQDLERRYIQLLETRVFELQTQLSLAGIAPPKPETPPVVIEQPPPQVRLDLQQSISNHRQTDD